MVAINKWKPCRCQAEVKAHFNYKMDFTRLAHSNKMLKRALRDRSAYTAEGAPRHVHLFASRDCDVTLVLFLHDDASKIQNIC